MSVFLFMLIVFVEKPLFSNAIGFGIFERPKSQVVEHRFHTLAMSSADIATYSRKKSGTFEEVWPLSSRVLRGASQRFVMVVHPVVELNAVDMTAIHKVDILLDRLVFAIRRQEAIAGEFCPIGRDIHSDTAVSILFTASFLVDFHQITSVVIGRGYPLPRGAGKRFFFNDFA